MHPYIPPGGIFKPNTRADLVAIVQMIEDGDNRAKGVGSVYSLSRAPDSDGFVIDTKVLNRHLSQPFPSPSIPLSASRFPTPAHNAQWLGTLAHPGFPQTGRSLIHVQAGIQIRLLLEDLASMGLAVPTMGAGGGQTLAGALSTATHGSDVNLRLLGDAVRAVHLVGPGGQEWWVESNGGSGTGTSYSQLPDWCSDTIVVRDTDFLQSVVVGVGRFGIIYSMVLEVVPQYLLEERRHETTWSQTRSALLTAVASGYTTAGNVFADPLNGSALRFWQVVVDPASGSRAWITRRWLTTNPTTVGLEKGLDVFGFLCTHNEAAKAAAIAATVTLITVLSQVAIAIFTAYIGIPFVGPILAAKKAAPYFKLVVDLLAAIMDYSTLGSFIATVIDLLRKAGDSVGHGLVDDVITEIAGAILSAEHDPPLRRGPSQQILDTHNYDLDGCFSVNSAEFFFDAASSSYIQFVDDVLQKAKDLGPIIGIVSLRFMRETTSKLGMQRFPLTVAIEVAISRPGSVNKQYQDAVHSLALAHGGIPHWGQEHTLDETKVEQLYQDHLEPWRWALAETEARIARTFSSDFTDSRGLETRDTLGAFRARRYIAAIISGAD